MDSPTVRLTVLLVLAILLVPSPSLGAPPVCLEQDHVASTIFQVCPLRKGVVLDTRPDPAGTTQKPEWDPNGYLFFCLCMGRFGNQVEQLLGSLVFAQAVNRTVLLPPFVIYRDGSKTDYTLTQFSDFFEVEPLELFHRSIGVVEFNRVFGECWPTGTPNSFQCLNDPPKANPCHGDAASRDSAPAAAPDTFSPPGLENERPQQEQPPAEQQPPLRGAEQQQCTTWKFDSNNPDLKQFQLDGDSVATWKARFPPDKYPLVVMTEAPAHFPVYAEHRILQSLLRWQPKLITKRDNWIKRHLHRPYIGLHLRNGVDWADACSLITEPTPRYMASPQCNHEGFMVSREICLPPDNYILLQTLNEAIGRNATTLFVSTDNRTLRPELEAIFARANREVTIVDGTGDVAMDLMIHGQADYFFGNCVSTFTSFIKRDRDIHRLPSGFWGLVSKS